jgi:putative transposase
MPSRNIIKTYVKDGFYHIYNRGVEKRIIFEDTQDYKVFLRYLKEYLSPPPDLRKFYKEFTLKGSTFKGVPRLPNNYQEKIDLLAFCLMPNHFHLMVRQKDDQSIKDFMKSLLTRYSMYFNKRNNRVGPLFQSIYKAVLINNENYLLHLSRYIHLNPLEFTRDLISSFSSYQEYLGMRHTEWIKPNIVLSYFQSEVKTGSQDFIRVNTYKDFVEKYERDSATVLGSTILE